MYKSKYPVDLYLSTLENQMWAPVPNLPDSLAGHILSWRQRPFCSVTYSLDHGSFMSLFLTYTRQEPLESSVLQSTHQLQCGRAQWMLADWGAWLCFSSISLAMRPLSGLSLSRDANESDFVVFWVEILYSFEQGWDNSNFTSDTALCWLFFKLHEHTCFRGEAQQLTERNRSWASPMAQATGPRQ